MTSDPKRDDRHRSRERYRTRLTGLVGKAPLTFHGWWGLILRRSSSADNIEPLKNPMRLEIGAVIANERESMRSPADYVRELFPSAYRLAP